MWGDLVRQVARSAPDTVYVALPDDRRGWWVLVVTALFTAISAIASFKAAEAAAASVRDQRQSRDQDRRQYLYRRLVLDVILDRVPEFVKVATGILQKGTEEIAGSAQGMLHPEVLGATRDLAQQFQRPFYELRLTLRAAVTAWDPALWEKISAELESLEDKVTLAIEQLAAQDEPNALQLQQILADSTAQIYRITVEQADAIASPAKVETGVRLWFGMPGWWQPW